MVSSADIASVSLRATPPPAKPPAGSRIGRIGQQPTSMHSARATEDAPAAASLNSNRSKPDTPPLRQSPQQQPSPSKPTPSDNSLNNNNKETGTSNSNNDSKGDNTNNTDSVPPQASSANVPLSRTTATPTLSTRTDATPPPAAEPALPAPLNALEQQFIDELNTFRKSPKDYAELIRQVYPL